MTNTARHCVLTAALSGALLSAAATCPPVQTRAVATTGIQVSQYCDPQESNFDVHRFYCRNERTPVGLPGDDRAALG